MNRVAIAAVVLPCAFLAVLLLMRQRPAVREPVFVSVPAPTPALAPAPATVASPGEIRGLARVIDGDTVEVAGNRIRLEGIDAPEGAQKCQRTSRSYFCGREASNALRDFVAIQPLRCVPNGRDQYKRVLATCFVESSGIDIGGWMVEQGYAFAFLRYSRKYVALQQAASDARRGFWTGSFAFPWDYRDSLRSERNAGRVAP